jgi:hydrogenase maturation protein HypF
MGYQRRILAVGGQEKNTFCLVRGAEAILSQHIGELSDISTFEQYRQEIEHFCHMFKIEPELMVCDLHPDYLSTRYARQSGLPLLRYADLEQDSALIEHAREAAGELLATHPEAANKLLARWLGGQEGLLRA